MEVEDVLPAGCSVRLEEGHAVGVENLVETMGDRNCQPPDICRGLVTQSPDVGEVLLRRDERVTVGRGVDVEEATARSFSITRRLRSCPATMEQKGQS